MSLSFGNYALYLAYMLASIVMAVLFSAAYLRITPVDELANIRQGNLACALSFGGALVGFCFALVSAMTHSMGVADFAMWGFCAAIVQIVMYFAAAKMVPNVSDELESNNVAVGTLCCALSLAIGLLNAACLVD